MAASDRSSRDRLSAALADLAENPRGFDFFAALRLVECFHAEAPRVGRARRPVEEPVRLAQSVSLGFAPSTVTAFTTEGKSDRPRLEVAFFGLFGPNGPLPLHLTELAYVRQHNHHDPTLRRFADVFHHRLLSLFYRAWSSAQPVVHHDRPDSDRFRLYLGSLTGLAGDEFADRDAMPDAAKLFFAGLLTPAPRNAEGLASMIATFFEVDAHVETFVGRWLDVPSEAHFRIGESPRTGRLGETITLGRRVWDCQHKFRIVMGPMRFADFRRFLPRGASFARLAAMVRRYTTHELEWDLQLVLARADKPALSLDGTVQLGFTSWLGDDGCDEDLDDVVIQPVDA